MTEIGCVSHLSTEPVTEVEREAEADGDMGPAEGCLSIGSLKGATL